MVGVFSSQQVVIVNTGMDGAGSANGLKFVLGSQTGSLGNS